MSGRNIARAQWRWAAAMTALVLLASSAPVLWGALTTPPNFHYIGFAYNWEEANAYLAKIVQGARGEWLYTLPYNAEPGEPFLLYANYLLLGHLARWFGLEPILVFHLARLVGGAVCLLTLYWFCARFFHEVRDRRLAFGLAATGAGLGWIALLFGYRSADLWQVQVFPFLAIFANVHFPPAMACMLWLGDALVPARTHPIATGRLISRLLIGSLVLALTQPYGLVVAAATGALWLAVRTLARAPLRELSMLAARMSIVMVVAAPFAFYYRWLGANNSSYAGWDRQNITLSAPAWDYALAFGLLLVCAAWGAVVTMRQRDGDTFLLLSWVVVACVLMYLPITQQRRFAFALAVPIAVLAVRGLNTIRVLNRPPVRFAIWLASSLTNLLLLGLALAATSLHPSYLFFTQGEWNALAYLRQRASPTAVVLASSDLGLYIPAWSGQRVIYGHPHETLEAPVRRAEVDAYFSGSLAHADAFLRPVDYIFMGPRERALGTPQIPAPFAPVFVDGDVIIYARR